MSRNKLFRMVPSLEYVKRLIEETCIHDEQGYLLTKDCFKRIKLLRKLSEIQKELLQFYVLSKQSYVENMSIYNGFSNVFRQLCRCHDIPVTSHIIYVHSTYETQYRLDIYSGCVLPRA